MIELKFTAIKPNGSPITGSFSAPTLKEGKAKVQKLVAQHKLKLKAIEKKSTFIYKIKKGSEKPITGEQKAFNKDEVKNALTKLGYTVISVNKKLLDFNLKPPPQEVLSFVKISAELMEQKLPFSEIMTLLTSDLENKTLKETLKQMFTMYPA